MTPPPVVPTIATIAPPGAPVVALDAAGRIAIDITCRKCGYNLRGLLPDGRCPECGTAVGRSLHGDLLRFSDPEWVQKLASGMNWIVASIVISLFGGALGAISGGIFSSIVSTRSFVVLAPLSGLVLGVFSLVGYWKVTTPDPAKMMEESGVSLRKLVRLAEVTRYVVAPLNSLMQQLAWSVAAIVLIAVSGIASLVGTVAIFLYARKLALRIPDEKLARHCRIVMWGMAVMLALFVTLALLLVVVTLRLTATTTTTTAPAGPTTMGSGKKYSVTYPASGGTTSGGVTATKTIPGLLLGTMAIAGSSCILGVGFLIFGIWALRLLLRFRRALNESAQIARQTWATQPLSAFPPNSGT